MTNFLDDLPQNVKRIAEKGNISTAEEALTTSTEKIIAALQGCTENDVRMLKAAAAKIVAQTTTSVNELLSEPWLEKWSRITFGCAGLDRCTRGGIATRGITEICGVSGAGKTQLLLQLSLTVQLPQTLGGLGKAVAYVCTEDVFPSKRLYQMAASFEKRYTEQDINYLGNIYIEHVIESEQLLECVETRLAKLMTTTAIGLIIIDSVAAVFRVQTDYIKRAQEMRKLANCLLRYVNRYNCAVVCVNQVTTIIDKNVEAPCLGLAWAHLGRTRLKVSRVPKEVKIKQKLLTVRKLEVMYSPETPNDFAEFLITENGVCDVP